MCRKRQVRCVEQGQTKAVEKAKVQACAVRVAARGSRWTVVFQFLPRNSRRQKWHRQGVVARYWQPHGEGARAPRLPSGCQRRHASIRWWKQEAALCASSCVAAHPCLLCATPTNPAVLPVAGTRTPPPRTFCLGVHKPLLCFFAFSSTGCIFHGFSLEMHIITNVVETAGSLAGPPPSSLFSLLFSFLEPYATQLPKHANLLQTHTGMDRRRQPAQGLTFWIGDRGEDFHGCWDTVLPSCFWTGLKNMLSHLAPCNEHT